MTCLMKYLMKCLMMSDQVSDDVSDVLGHVHDLFFLTGRVGGRTLTLSLPASNGLDSWDMGGQWVGR